MRVYTTIAHYQKYLIRVRAKKQTIAFVPTMGALHVGHLELMKHAQSLADRVVVSIFVNPTQFNDPEDLTKYPRPLAKDIHLLEQLGVNALFLPTVNQMYPKDLDLSVPVQLDAWATVMEGAYRPGHFEGVVMVVHRLLDIVRPDILIMGQKDFQQKTLIAEMIRQLKLPIKLIAHPIVRESDGLAFSSRNVRIDPSRRSDAVALRSALLLAKKSISTHSPDQIKEKCIHIIADAGFRLEYFDIVDHQTLRSIQSWQDTETPVACAAAWLGEVRLIDNEILSE